MFVGPSLSLRTHPPKPYPRFEDRVAVWSSGGASSDGVRRKSLRRRGWMAVLIVPRHRQYSPGAALHRGHVVVSRIRSVNACSSRLCWRAAALLGLLVGSMFNAHAFNLARGIKFDVRRPCVLNNADDIAAALCRQSLFREPKRPPRPSPESGRFAVRAIIFNIRAFSRLTARQLGPKSRVISEAITPARNGEHPMTKTYDEAKTTLTEAATKFYAARDAFRSGKIDANAFVAAQKAYAAAGDEFDASVGLV